MDIKEVDNIVSQLNEEIYDMTEFDYWFPVSLLTNGDIIIVNYFDMCIWDSENDEREYIENDVDDYGPLMPYLKKQIMEINKTIRKIKWKG